MEEKRVEFMHHSFSVYVNILSTTTNHDQEVREKVIIIAAAHVC
jgi:hypothetical protein